MTECRGLGCTNAYNLYVLQYMYMVDLNVAAISTANVTEMYLKDINGYYSRSIYVLLNSVNGCG